MIKHHILTTFQERRVYPTATIGEAFNLGFVPSNSEGDEYHVPHECFIRTRQQDADAGAEDEEFLPHCDGTWDSDWNNREQSEEMG